VNQFYDESRDALILAPVFAVNVNPQAPIDLADDYRDAAWFDRDEATARLPFSGQRWAVRHIDEIMSLGDAETGIYRIDMDTVQPVQRNPEDADDFDDDDSLATNKYNEQDASPDRSATPDLDASADDSGTESAAPPVGDAGSAASEDVETVNVSSARKD
jgi:hypothetical protein